MHTQKTEIIEALGAMEQRLDQQNEKLEYAPVTNYLSKVVRLQQGGRKIAIWSDAIDAALAENGSVYLPATDEAYYIDRPIILDGGMHLKADKAAVIRCIDGMETCMARNKNIRPVKYGDAPCANPQRDTGITITGGIWDHESCFRSHDHGQVDKEHSVFTENGGGLFLFISVSDLSITNLRVVRSPCFAFYIGNAENLLVRDITFEECYSDGVHINGPSKNIVVKNLDGLTSDDFVAVNAWYDGISGGPVECAWLKDLHMGWGGFRGVRLLVDKASLANIVFENLTGIRSVNMDPFPHETPFACDGRLRTCSTDSMDWIYFENVDFLSPYIMKGVKYNGCIEVHTHSKHLSFKNIRGELPHIKVGPKMDPVKDAHGRPAWRAHCDWDCTIETMVLEGFPKEEQDVVEILHGNQGGKGEIKNLIFQ